MFDSVSGIFSTGVTFDMMEQYEVHDVFVLDTRILCVSKNSVYLLNATDLSEIFSL